MVRIPQRAPILLVVLMKLKEIDKVKKGYNILEVLDSECDVAWTVDKDGTELGSFILNEVQYTIIYVPRYMKLKNRDIDVVEVGFGWGEDSSAKLTNLNKNASKVLGCVYNAVLPKLKKDNPDIIVIAVQDEFGSVEKRKSLYTHIIRQYQKLSNNGYLLYRPFYKIGTGEYSYISKELNLNKEDKIEFDKQLVTLAGRKIASTTTE